MDRSKALRQMRLLRELTDSELSLVSGVIKQHRFKKGRSVVLEGTPGGSIYLVQDGVLKVNHSVRGRRRDLGTFRPGDHFGEVSFIDRKPRSASVFAAEDSTLFSISRDDFEHLLSEDSTLKMKLMQSLLQDLAEKLRERKFSLDFELADLLPISIFETDQKGVITFANRNGLEAFGYDQSDFDRGLSLFKLFAKSNRAVAQASVKKVLTNGKKVQAEFTGVTTSGKEFPLIFQCDLIKVSDKAKGLRVTLLDVSLQKQTEVQLEETEERYRLLFELNPYPTWVQDQGGQFLAVNQAAITHYGFTKNEFRTMNAKELYAKSAKHTAGHSNGYRMVLVKHQKKDGVTIDVEVTSHPLVFRGHKALLVIANDITSRKLMEDELRSAHDKLEERVRERTAELLQSNMILQEQIEERKRVEKELSKNQEKYLLMFRDKERS